MVSAFVTLHSTSMVVMETFTMLGDISHKVFLIIDMQIQQKLFECCITPLLIHMTLFLSSKRNSRLMSVVTSLLGHVTQAWMLMSVCVCVQ